MEIWKDIKDYEGYYQVSNTGKVRSVDRLGRCGKYGTLLYKGRELKAGVGSHGYCNIVLSKKSKTKTRTVHSLVAEYFVDGYKEGYEVNHIDFEKTNNHVDNLEWVTPSYNSTHGWQKRRRNAVCKRK